MKKAIIGIIVIILVALGIYYFVKSSNRVTVLNDGKTATTTPVQTASTTPTVNKEQTVIGKSVEGRDILAYHFGTGADEVLFVAGIHGGYAWNTALLGFQTADYLKANPNVIPANMKVTVIPVLNPDGLVKAVGTSSKFTASDVSKSSAVLADSRFNASKVDLNRNFDCDWQSSAKWQSKTVSGGETVFSEPEALALKNYIDSAKPKAVVAYYSAAGGVYASNCHTGILPTTSALTNTYAQASGYKAFEEFDFYETTGDMTNWLAKSGIPAISILLTNHTDTEWTKNLAGIKAVIKYYTK